MKLKDVISNVKTNKYTTGTGIAVLLLIGLKLSGVNVEQKVGIPIADLTLYLGTAIQSLLLIFAKDPNKK